MTASNCERVTTLQSNYGQCHCARLLLLGALGVLLGLAMQPGRVRARYEDTAWPLAIGVEFTFTATGHARTTHPPWLALALDTAHLSAMAAWLGGLVVLVAALLPRRVSREKRPSGSRRAAVHRKALVDGTESPWVS